MSLADAFAVATGRACGAAVATGDEGIIAAPGAHEVLDLR